MHPFNCSSQLNTRLKGPSCVEPTREVKITAPIAEQLVQITSLTWWNILMVMPPESMCTCSTHQRACVRVCVCVCVCKSANKRSYIHVAWAQLCIYKIDASMSLCTILLARCSCFYSITCPSCNCQRWMVHPAMMGRAQLSLPWYSGMRAVCCGPPCSTKLSHVPHQAKLVKSDAWPCVAAKPRLLLKLASCLTVSVCRCPKQCAHDAS